MNVQHLASGGEMTDDDQSGTVDAKNDGSEAAQSRSVQMLNDLGRHNGIQVIKGLVIDSQGTGKELNAKLFPSGRLGKPMAPKATAKILIHTSQYTPSHPNHRDHPAYDRKG